MIECGIDVEAQHHEVATGGQCEIDMRFDALVEMADKVLKYKYIVKNVAKKYGKTVTFMPKPLFQDNGSGMHMHISLWKNGDNLFAGRGYAGLSATWACTPSAACSSTPRRSCAFTNPTTNSYKRLVPGYEAPVNLAYSRAQPLGVDPHPDVPPEPEGEAGRVPLPGPARAIRTSRSPRC